MTPPRDGKRRGADGNAAVFIYIAAEQLQRLGFDPNEPAPYYRVWESSDGRPRLVVNLYREQ